MSEYEFTQDWFHWAPPLLTQVVPMLPERKRLLEIGAYEGRSTVWFVENMLEDGGAIVAIDTWEGGEEHKAMGHDMKSVEDRFNHNTGLLTAKYPGRYISKVKDTSYHALAGLVDFPQFDFIYIDGSHIAKDVLTDACMAWPLLKPHGVMVFDDYLWRDGPHPLHRPKIAVDTFSNIFDGEFDVIHIGYQYAIRKKV